MDNLMAENNKNIKDSLKGQVTHTQKKYFFLNVHCVSEILTSLA